MKHGRHEDRPGDVLQRARLLRHVLPVSLNRPSCELRAPAPILCGRPCDHAGLLLATQQRKLLFPDPTSDACGRARLYVIRLSEEGRSGGCSSTLLLNLGVDAEPACAPSQAVPREVGRQGGTREPRRCFGPVSPSLDSQRRLGILCREALAAASRLSIPRLW